jgi:hypothetical protein
MVGIRPSPLFVDLLMGMERHYRVVSTIKPLLLSRLLSNRNVCEPRLLRRADRCEASSALQYRTNPLFGTKCGLKCFSVVDYIGGRLALKTRNVRPAKGGAPIRRPAYCGRAAAPPTGLCLAFIRTIRGSGRRRLRPLSDATVSDT